MTANNRKAWQRGSLLSLLIVPILSVPAFAVPTERTTTYTYQPPGGNGAGLIATMDGPRTGPGDTTTYTYNSAGNLQIIDNALHYTIQLLDYCLHHGFKPHLRPARHVAAAAAVGAQD